MRKPKKPGESRDRNCVMILGMHRSGTSALAGVLSKLGCKIPASPMPACKSNAKEFFEFAKASDLNDEMMTSV
jgi:hypothetical protein